MNTNDQHRGRESRRAILALALLTLLFAALGLWGGYSMFAVPREDETPYLVSAVLGCVGFLAMGWIGPAATRAVERRVGRKGPM